MMLCGWEINHSRDKATLSRGDYSADVTVTLSPDGCTIRLYDHESYYASHAQAIPLAVIEALRPGGKHAEDDAEEGWVDP